MGNLDAKYSQSGLRCFQVRKVLQSGSDVRLKWPVSAVGFFVCLFVSFGVWVFAVVESLVVVFVDFWVLLLLPFFSVNRRLEGMIDYL